MEPFQEVNMFLKTLSYKILPLNLLSVTPEKKWGRTEGRCSTCKFNYIDGRYIVWLVDARMPKMTQIEWSVRRVSLMYFTALNEWILRNKSTTFDVYNPKDFQKIFYREYLSQINWEIVRQKYFTVLKIQEKWHFQLWPSKVINFSNYGKFIWKAQ